MSQNAKHAQIETFPDPILESNMKETSEGQMTHPTEQQSVPKDTCVSSQWAQGTQMQVDNVSWEEDICRICNLFASSAET